MTEVTITFKVPQLVYREYEEILDMFLNELDELGVEDIDTLEEEGV